MFDTDKADLALLIEVLTDAITRNSFDHFADLAHAREMLDRVKVEFKKLPN